MLVTVEELLKKGIEKRKKDKFKVYLVELDREIECTTISASEYLDILGSKSRNKAAEVIYTSCNIFKDETLINRLDCKFDPVEVVEKILGYGTVFHLSEYILEKSQIDTGEKSKYIKEMENDIKN